MNAKKAVCIILPAILIAAALMFKSYIDRKNIKENYNSPVSERYVGVDLTEYEYEATVVSIDKDKMICVSAHDYTNDNYNGRYSELAEGTEMILLADDDGVFGTEKVSKGDKICFRTIGPEDIDDKGRLIMQYSSFAVK